MPPAKLETPPPRLHPFRRRIPTRCIAWGRRGYHLAWILPTLVLLLGTWHLWSGTTVPPWDAGSFHAPAQILVADAARAGRFLLWNPWIGGGSPDGADPQIGAFSPMNVLLGMILGGSLRGFVFYWLFVWWLGGWGMLRLARHLGAPAWGAAVAATGLLCCGFYVGHAEHTSILVGFSALPFLIWRLDAALRTRRLGPAVEAGALWGLAALACYPALTILNGCYMALWAVGRARASRALTALVLVAAVGGLVLSPAYVAFFLEGKDYTVRAQGLPREVAVGSNALHPRALATFASPYVAVLGLVRQGLWTTDPSSASIYLPAAVLPLALAGLFCRPRSAWRLYLGLLALLALGFALGDTLPLRGLLYDFFPPSRYFRHAAVFRGYFLLTTLILALLAARDLARPASAAAWRRLFWASLATAAAAAVALLGVSRLADVSGTHFHAAAGIALVLWLAVAALARLAGRPRFRRASLCLLVALVCVDGGSALVMSRYFLADWTETGRSAWRAAEQAHDPRLDLSQRGFARSSEPRFGVHRNNRNVVAKEASFRNYLIFSNLFYSSWTRSPLLTGAVTGEDRFYFTPTVLEVPFTEPAFERFAERCRELSGMPVVVRSRAGAPPPGEAAVLAAIARLPRARPVTVDLVRYVADELRLSVTVPEAGHLLLTDRFARGWRARINGAEAEIRPANFLFRAVELPAGESRVDMVYRPAGFPGLLLLSWGTLLVVGASSLQRARRPTRPGRRPPWRSARSGR